MFQGKAFPYRKLIETGFYEWTNNQDWHPVPLKSLDGYNPKDVYNANEAVLFYNLFPGRTLAVKGNTRKGGKCSKESFIVLFCANINGSHKLTPLTIVKSNTKSLNAWVTRFLLYFTYSQKSVITITFLGIICSQYNRLCYIFSFFPSPKKDIYYFWYKYVKSVLE